MNTYSTKELSVIGEMALQMAHDLRSPLTALIAVITNAQIEHAQKNLALKAAKRVQEITDELLLKHQQAIIDNKNNVLLLEILHELIAEKKVLLPKEIQLNIRSDTNLKIKISDEKSRELKRILSNLINNSIEAIFKKSIQGSINIFVRENQNKTIIEVQDDGCGMPAEIAKKIGRMGFSWQKRGGHGLGLYRAKNILKRWGGRLDIHSELGKGTQVKMFF